MQTATKEIRKYETRLNENTEQAGKKKFYTPHIDIIERKDDIVIIADMPGVDEKSVDITLEKDTLTLYGKTDHETPEGYRLTVSEYGFGDYQRSFTLSDEIERENIQAKVNNGILRLILPKSASLKTRKIPVTAES